MSTREAGRHEAFAPVRRDRDRIAHPERVIPWLPQAVASRLVGAAVDGLAIGARCQ